MIGWHSSCSSLSSLCSTFHWNVTRFRLLFVCCETKWVSRSVLIIYWDDVASLPHLTRPCWGELCKTPVVGSLKWVLASACTVWILLLHVSWFWSGNANDFETGLAGIWEKNKRWESLFMTWVSGLSMMKSYGFGFAVSTLACKLPQCGTLYIPPCWFAEPEKRIDLSGPLLYVRWAESGGCYERNMSDLPLDDWALSGLQ